MDRQIKSPDQRCKCDWRSHVREVKEQGGAMADMPMSDMAISLINQSTIGYWDQSSVVEQLVVWTRRQL